MTAILLRTLGKIGLKLLTAFLAEKVLEKLIFSLLERAASQTTNKVDDVLVADLKAAYEA
jgi:hypothetical protein